MKKFTVALMMAGALLMAGCGSKEKVIDGNAKSQGSASTQSESKQAAAKGYVFVSGGTAVEIDALAAPILEKLGKPGSYYEAASCAFEGLDKTYTYKGFELDTYPSGKDDLVSAVIFKDDSIKTPEGIGIGDSAEKVKEAYGEGKEAGGMLVYEKDGMKLNFVIKDGDVASIEYRTMVLD